MWNKTKYDSDVHETNKKQGGEGNQAFQVAFVLFLEEGFLCLPHSVTGISKQGPCSSQVK